MADNNRGTGVRKLFMNYGLTQIKMGIFGVLTFVWLVLGNNLFYHPEIEYNTLIGITESVISVAIAYLIYRTKINGE